jgi:hypothetical protein
MRVSHVCTLATSPARLEARMDSLLSLPGRDASEVFSFKARLFYRRSQAFVLFGSVLI